MRGRNHVEQMYEAKRVSMPHIINWWCCIKFHHKSAINGKYLVRIDYQNITNKSIAFSNNQSAVFSNSSIRIVSRLDIFISETMTPHELN